MAISDRLKALLDSSKVRYTVVKHPVVYTAQEIAAAQHVSGRQLAKCVLVKTDRGCALAVLPATQLVDLKKLKGLLKAKTVGIAKEADIKAAFPDVEVGAMSPFGHLYGVPVVADRALGESAEIVCNAGSHIETVKLRYQDFLTLAKPRLGSFGQAVGGQAKRKKTRLPSARRTRSSAKRSAHRPSASRKR